MSMKSFTLFLSKYDENNPKMRRNSSINKLRIFSTLNRFRRLNTNVFQNDRRMKWIEEKQTLSRIYQNYPNRIDIDLNLIFDVFLFFYSQDSSLRYASKQVRKKIYFCDSICRNLRVRWWTYAVGLNRTWDSKAGDGLCIGRGIFAEWYRRRSAAPGWEREDDRP